MKIIKSKYINRSGEEFDVEYRDVNSFDQIDHKNPRTVAAICFCEGKLLIVHSSERDSWTPVSGGIEEGESVMEASVREVKEESNMKVIKILPIGFQEIIGSPDYTVQARVFCKVEPIGNFDPSIDPDGDIDEIKLIDPKESKKYFDWREIGDYVLKRAIDFDKV